MVQGCCTPNYTVVATLQALLAAWLCRQIWPLGAWPGCSSAICSREGDPVSFRVAFLMQQIFASDLIALSTPANRQSLLFLTQCHFDITLIYREWAFAA